jgi:hypothetical protein
MVFSQDRAVLVACLLLLVARGWRLVSDFWNLVAGFWSLASGNCEFGSISPRQAAGHPKVVTFYSLRFAIYGSLDTFYPQLYM